MNLALWIVTGVLAAVLLVSTSKMVVPREKIASVGHAAEWVLDFSPAPSGPSESSRSWPWPA